MSYQETKPLKKHVSQQDKTNPGNPLNQICGPRKPVDMLGSSSKDSSTRNAEAVGTSRQRSGETRVASRKQSLLEVDEEELALGKVFCYALGVTKVILTQDRL